MTRPTSARRLLAPFLLCCCITGCARFQDGPSVALPAAERLVLEDRGQLHVVDLHPDGPAPILLIHGYGGSIASYKPVLGELSRDHRVIAVDLPGFGRSDRRAGDYSPEGLADVLARVLDAKGIDRAHVVGHSWGASIALAFAMRHPERVDRLVLVSGWVYDEELLPLMRWARAGGIGEALFATFYRAALGERLYFNFYDPSLVTEEMVDEVERMMAPDGTVAAALAAARGMRFADHQAGYSRVRAETLLLWGREDRVARLAFGERLAREMPRARLVVLGRCGHIPMIECRGETTAALRDFLVIR